MIASLDDAWRWYESARGMTLAMRQLGRRHWDELPWDGPLGRDARLRDLTSSEIQGWAEAVLDDLDDLCILLLFSVFEAAVRERVLTEIKQEVPEPRHLAIIHALDALNEAVEHGSFYKVLEPYKHLDAALLEQVSQVRRYRNWVAHGRRGSPQSAVVPRDAYDRLRRFLDRLDEEPGPAPPSG